MLDHVKKLAEKNFDWMVRLRRFFHANPELAFQEFKTSQKVQSELKRLKIDIITRVKTGVVGFLKGSSRQLVCALRTDMDALPIQEKTELKFKSKTPGHMHACGHDIHMATVLGAAKILSNLRKDLNGSVKFIFQPAEEAPPGGAIEMIKAGVMKSPAVKMIFGLHTDPNIPTGKIGYRDGVLMSEVLDFNLMVRGRGGHGARPQDTIDSIVISAQLVNALQAIVSRVIDPNRPAVLTIGKIEGGTARNVIAGEVRMRGTIRGTESKTVDDVKKALEKVAAGICRAHGARCNLEYVAGYPVLYNDPGANRFLVETAESLYGKKSVTYLPEPALGGEDFAHYLLYAPGAMFRLGTRNRQVGAIYPWHNDRYNADERSMIFGSAILAGAVIKYFEQKG
jgi:amidohydrolase